VDAVPEKIRTFPLVMLAPMQTIFIRWSFGVHSAPGDPEDTTSASASELKGPTMVPLPSNGKSDSPLAGTDSIVALATLKQKSPLKA
jgi:hypothetical protein